MMVRQKRKKRKLPVFYRFGAHICHMKNIFMEKKILHFVSFTLYLSKTRNRISLPYSKKQLWPF